ncbi:MAG: trypsin-like peptidase domain-containing protein, partial [Candidatus Nealsonbacteria bacterium]|nr:trypsin-like peptidase domain-containing protein [Candidatus Nealsonbacteria bacterium]
MTCLKPLALMKLCWLLSILTALSAPPALFAAEDGLTVPAPKNVDELKSIQAQVQKVVAKVLPCTVGVQIGAARGSGVIVSEDGIVMTAGHVVGEPGKDVTFFFADGKTAKGKTLGMYKTADAGLMKIADEGKWPFVEKGRSGDLKLGAWCVAVGHPLGYQKERPPVVRVGRVLRSGETVIQTDCPLVGGDSGGPLFDLEGRVIGINSRIGGSTSSNFHVPVDVFHDCWDRLLKGESWETSLPGRDSSEVKSSFREVVAAAAKCAVRVKCDGKDAALGTIIGPDGWVLTKASQLKGDIVCRFRDERELEAQLVGVHKQFDLAMLKIDAHDLPEIQWNTAKLDVGQWVAAAGPADDPLAIGAVSVPARRIIAIPGQLGVVLKDGKGGAEADKVLPKSPAEKAGLKPNDLITHVNGKPTANIQEVIAAVRTYRIGDKVELTLKRKDKELKITATLGRVDSPASRKRDMQNSMGVGLSKRRDDFPIVVQHDTVVRPADCGGPLVDLSGKVVGVNIARGGRTETYTAPADALLPLMYDLMSGRLTPPEIVKQREEARKKAEEEAKKKAEEEAKKKAEEEKKKADEAARLKAEEEKRKADEEAKRKADEEAKRKAEQEKQKAEEAARLKAEEDKRKADEEAKRKADEEAEKQEQPEEKPA